MKPLIYCPKCRQERSVSVNHTIESYPVKNEPIEIKAEVFICDACGEELWDQKADDRNLEKAYRIYRKNHQLLQPEEIKNIRDRYGLTQIEYARLLGLGDKTVTRYEAGSIQDNAPNNLMVLSRSPEVMRFLLERGRSLLSKQKFSEVMEKVNGFEANTIKKMTPLLLHDREDDQ
ncbi:MAG: type II toxin-antitoxin system MqsA family antitoxin [Clostridiales bacterium]|nr:type II toxin-antitoxin system MqsA family antitoxin [Clostridiales bacterium]